jgi:cysteine desulfurase
MNKPRMNDRIYLDYAAATPVDGRVLAAMQPYFAETFYNPSATYAPAREVADVLEAARARVSHWLGVRPAEIVFTAGGTEANNLAIYGVMQHSADYPDANIVVSAIEHDAVSRPAARYDCRQVPVGPDGIVSARAVADNIDDKTVLVSVMYANNEIGTLQPLKDIAQHVKDERNERRKRGDSRPLYLHTDACQASNYLDLHAARLGVDMMTLNGGKMYGPKQSGILYVKAGIELVPMIVGGGQERGLRSGTENVAACIGLAEALDIAQAGRHEELARMQALQTLFIDQLKNVLPAAVINGSLKKRLPNNVHITVPGQDNERLLLQLESRGILAAAGSACSASSQEPSHVLRAIGLSDADAQASLRFSMGRATDATAVRRTISTLAELVI